MALLGKISAVLSANTQDFTRNLGTAKKELSDFAKRVRGIELNINTRALDGTLTKLQKFQRTVQEIAGLQAKGIDLGIDPRKLEDQFRVFEDIGKPLTKLVGQIEGLSTNLQAGLYPALGQVQRGFQDIYRAIQGGRQLSEFSNEVDSLRGRLIALSRVTAASADLGKLVQSLDADNVGASFAQPFAKSALQKSLELRALAEKTPPRARADGVFADLAAEAERGAVRIERAAAKVFEIQLLIANNGATTGRKEALASAQQQLNAFVRLQEGINRRLQTELRSVQIKEIVTPQATAAADDLIKKLSTAAQTLRTVGGSSFEPLISGVGRVAEQFVRGEASAARLAKAIGAINAASNSLSTGKGLLERTNSLLFSSAERERQKISSNFDRQRANAEPSQLPRIERRRDVQLSRLALNEEIIPELKSLQGRAAELGSPELKQRADDLLVSSRQISKALKDADNSAKSGNINASNASYEKANRLLAEQGNRYRELARDIQITNDARRQQDLFLQASGGRGEQLSQGARDAAADLSVARQFRGQISSGSARIEIQSEIERVTASVTGLQQKIAEVASSKLGAAEKIKELDRLDNEIRQSTAGLAEFIAKLSNGAFSPDQVKKAMELARNTAGSISARGAQTVQLAFQQALFAVDDFVSSTGGLEYKLRAIGNNITQFGLLVGQSGIIPGLSATTGLFIGLSTVLAGQALSAILRWASGAEEAESRTKALNEALSKQKSLASELTQAFKSLGEAIGRQAFSEPAKQAREFRKELDEIIKKQKELSDARVAAANEGVVAARGAQDRVQQNLEKESDPGRRAALQLQIAEAQANERRLRDLAANERPPTGQEVGAALEGLISRYEEISRKLREAIDGGATALFPATAGTVASLGLSQNLRRETAGLPLGNDNQSIGRQIDALRAAQDLLKPLATETDRFGLGFQTSGARRANAEILQLEQFINRLLASKLDKAFVDTANSIFETSRKAATSIGEAQQQVADAIQLGVPEAIALRGNLDALGEQVAKATNDLADIAKRRNEGQITPAQADIESAAVRERANALSRQRRGIDEARRIARDAAVTPERLFSSRAARAGETLRESGFGSSDTARRLRALEFERTALTQNLAKNPGDAASRQQLEAQLKELSAIEAATLALAKFSESLNKASADAAANVSSARQRADEARNRQLLNNNRETRKLATRADEDLAAQQAAKIRVDAEVQAARIRLEQEAKAGGLFQAAFARVSELQQRLATEASPNPAIAQELATILGQIESRVQQNPRVREASDASRRLEETQQAARRGRDLSLGGGERAAEDLFRSIDDLRENARREIQANPANAGSIRSELNRDIERVTEESRRSIAPAAFALSDAVQNAILQGPSRAALNASDATTMEGSRELNRLLRGDDPARDANLLELQKQTSELTKHTVHLQKLAEGFAGVAP